MSDRQEGTTASDDIGKLEGTTASDDIGKLEGTSRRLGYTVKKPKRHIARAWNILDWGVYILDA
jgi:hypothetical protein